MTCCEARLVGSVKQTRSGSRSSSKAAMGNLVMRFRRRTAQDGIMAADFRIEKQKEAANVFANGGVCVAGRGLPGANRPGVTNDGTNGQGDPGAASLFSQDSTKPGS